MHMVDTDEVAITHLQRRKIEARVLLPLLQTLKEKLGEDVTREVLDATITRLAVADGTAWAASYGQTIAGLRRIALELWAGSGALDVEMIEKHGPPHVLWYPFGRGGKCEPSVANSTA